MKRSYLFLYTELAGYTIACLKALKASDPDCSITVIHFPVNKQAPFLFDFSSIGDFRSVQDIESYSALKALCNQVQPSHIVCSGWIKKEYVRLCFAWRKKAVTVLCFDNHLEKNLKQWVWRFTGAPVLRKIFSQLWLPGERQCEYARFLGFNDKTIHTGFYSCDLPVFTEKGKKVLPVKAASFPKVLLCVARYVPEKAYAELWDAFISWQEQEPSSWELWCVGAGPGYESRLLHPKIKHLGFIQPNEMDLIIEKAGVFVLISKFEPWGVAVHEFAAAGFPLLLSAQVGAADTFLNKTNGWLIPSQQQTEIVSAFRSIAAQSDEELLDKATNSMQLAARISPQTWAQTLIGM
ncbi:MAG: glycosyltransferase [Flavipsychrobacter sp.]|nr:glycosyltransferase [Flavipsychrobacter sp.]